MKVLSHVRLIIGLKNKWETWKKKSVTEIYHSASVWGQNIGCSPEGGAWKQGGVWGQTYINLYSLLPLRGSESLFLKLLIAEPLFHGNKILNTPLKKQHHLSHLSLLERDKRHKPSFTLRPSCTKGMFLLLGGIFTVFFFNVYSFFERQRDRA